MDDIAYPFEVVSFTSKNNTNEICGKLSCLQYPFNVHRGLSCRLEKTNDSKCILVFLLDNEYPNKLASFLSTNIKNPFFVVFCGPVAKWNQHIMDRSSGFCGWPCKPNELDIRLKNVLMRTKCIYSGEQQSYFEDEWLELNLVGQCARILEVKSLVRKMSQCVAPVLIEGETGTGKEGVARAIHFLSERSSKPFIPVNCGALPEHLIENELFGHEKGAYTDAKEHQQGAIAQADGGTLFLDEIECLSPKAQACLLRFTENQEYKLLGSKIHKTADVRIITATNSPILQLTEQALFRKDLMYRLNLVTIKLPELRQRGEDIKLLADYFIKKFSIRYGQPEKPLDNEAIAWMQQYAWPGNVRELENTIHRLILLNDKSLPESVMGEETMPGQERRKLKDRRNRFNFDQPFQAEKSRMIAEFEQRYISSLLTKTRGNISKGAELSGLERRALGKLMKKHGINKENF